MAESKPQKIKRLRGERNRRRKLRSNLLNRAEQHAKRIKLINLALKRLLSDDIPGVVDGWHVKAIRNQANMGIGQFLNVPAKLVWHTTEGSSLPNPYRPGTYPHFTLDSKRGLLYQHIPVTSGAMALENLAGGVETNRAHAIQVELVGFAAETPNWTSEQYARVAALARWIEAHCGVARKCSVLFVPVGHRNEMSASRWVDYSGHCGHQHVPEQPSGHSDPGAFRIGLVI